MARKPEHQWKNPALAEMGKRLRWARELVYGEQQNFAQVMGVDKTTLAKTERGERGLSIFNIISAANKLRVTTDYLLMGDLSGVDREIRLELVRRHPELLSPVPVPEKPRPPPVEPIWPPPAPLLPNGMDTSGHEPADHSRPPARTDSKPRKPAPAE